MKIYRGNLEQMLYKYEKHSRSDRFDGSTPEDWKNWKAESRRTLEKLLCLEKMEKPEPWDYVEERTELEDGIIREKVWIRTEPRTDMPCYILIPPKPNGSVFLALHGHYGGGKESIAGRRDDPDVVSAIEYYNYDYGYHLATLGYVVACPDSRGFGDRRDGDYSDKGREAKLGSLCFEMAHMAEGMGETLAGQMLWDNMALIDYLERRGEWQLNDLGCLGFSGGGLQTLWLASMDDRVRQAYISGYFYGVRDSLLVMSENCSCNYVPHLWEHFDMCDMAGLIAPRPLMIQSCSRDHLNGSRGLENVTEQLEELRKIYGLLGAEDRLVHDIQPGRHCWHGDRLEEITQYFSKILSK